uniref:Ground-like domain-containing protein n=1 Tax=Parascaris univalens TaxID=6257 RepID=A0A915AEI0_PARUN
MILRCCIIALGLLSILECANVDRSRRQVDETNDLLDLINQMGDKDDLSETICTDWMLQVAMEDSMTNDTVESKQSVQEAAEAVLGTRLDVACARGELSFAVSSRRFCKVTLGEITCYAFEPSE